MDTLETLRQDVLDGRISVERLVELLASVQRQLQAAHQRIAELEKQVGSPPTAKLDQPFSLRSEEQRQAARGKKRKPKRSGRRGRLTTKDKLARAERTELVYPEGPPRQACQLSHTRPVWRLEHGRAVLVAYAVYRGPGGQYGQIPGVLGRSEFGLEIVTEIAYLVYIVGLSFDKVCLLLNFFQDLKLPKAQVDALLKRLARHWEHEFDVLCTLLAHSLVVHADETGWSLKSVWALLSEQARVLLFGVHKDAETLKQVLDPATFAGLVVSDHAAVYDQFTLGQKCWAHLLRKGIKLTLQDPANGAYRTLTDGLLALYHAACRLQRDQRYSPAGRASRVPLLDDAVWDLCGVLEFADRPPRVGLEHDYYLLVQEVLDLMFRQQLFQFVTAAPVQQPNGTTQPVAGTNNEAERTLRTPAQAPQTGRSNKTAAGARRQTVVASVLESLRLYLPSFTLQGVLAELERWQQAGRSCFARLLAQLQLTLPATSPLDRLFPQPIPTG